MIRDLPMAIAATSVLLALNNQMGSQKLEGLNHERKDILSGEPEPRMLQVLGSIADRRVLGKPFILLERGLQAFQRTLKKLQKH